MNNLKIANHVLTGLAVIHFIVGCANQQLGVVPTTQFKRGVSSQSEAFGVNDWPRQSVKFASSDRGVVSSDAELASQVGTSILRQGGNAVDAAVATAFALAVVHPAAGNIGGGGFLVTRIGNTSYALDFRETAPRKANRDMFLAVGAKDASTISHLAAGVPGSVAGLWEAYQKLGSKKIAWKDLVMPAVRLAREGFIMNEPFVRYIEKSKDKLSKHEASLALFLPSGRVPSVGERFVNKDLADTLQRIAEEGSAGFYQGKTAELIAEEMRFHGGMIDRDDLLTYQAKWRTPLEFDYRGHYVISMPPPSSGGVVLAMLCKMLEPYALDEFSWHSAKHVHLLAEVMRRSFLVRNALLGDPDFVKMPIHQLFSSGWMNQQRASIVENKATPTKQLADSVNKHFDGPHTTHFSVVDSEGNAVALTTTVNFWFGSGITVKGAGFVLNNEMDDFATNPGQPNGFGLVQGEANAISPGKRMLSSMTPTIVLDPHKKPVLVLGAAGGPTIITAVFQMLSNVLDFRMKPDMAAIAPRMHMQDFPDKIAYEKEGFSALVLSELRSMGYELEERERIADAPIVGRVQNQWVGIPEVRVTNSAAAGW